MALPWAMEFGEMYSHVRPPLDIPHPLREESVGS
jgi:hypothetical protein